MEGYHLAYHLPFPDLAYLHYLQELPSNKYSKSVYNIY